jgi:hypothetical protein
MGFPRDRDRAYTNARHRIGRRWGLIQDATIMFIGLLMLTAAWGVTQNGWVICYAWSLFFYSVGVGTFLRPILSYLEITARLTESHRR